METLLRDLSYVIRSLTRQPGYALLVIAVFALALDANTTVFSVFNGLFLRPLHYPDDERLVLDSEAREGALICSLRCSSNDQLYEKGQ